MMSAQMPTLANHDEHNDEHIVQESIGYERGFKDGLECAKKAAKDAEQEGIRQLLEEIADSEIIQYYSELIDAVELDIEEHYRKLHVEAVETRCDEKTIKGWIDTDAEVLVVEKEEVIKAINDCHKGGV